MADRKSANADGVRIVKAVYTKEPFAGGSKYKYFRQPFNIVEFEWGNGERTTLLELCLGYDFHSRTGDQGECYDEIVFMEPGELSRLPSIGRTDAYIR